VTAQREDTIARGDFAAWITSHIDSWFAFVRRLGLGVEKMEDIVLVTGRHRTRSRTNIAFYEGQAAAQVSFGVQVTGDVGAGINWQVSRRNIQGAMLSQGPSGVVCDVGFVSASRSSNATSDLRRSPIWTFRGSVWSIFGLILATTKLPRGNCERNLVSSAPSRG